MELTEKQKEMLRIALKMALVYFETQDTDILNEFYDLCEKLGIEEYID